MPIRFKLLLANLGLVAMLWVVGLWAARVGETALEDTARGHAIKFARDTMAEVQRALQERVHDWVVFTHSPSLRRTLAESNREFLDFADREQLIDARDRAWQEAKAPTRFMRDLSENASARELAGQKRALEIVSGHPVFGEAFVTNRWGANIAQTNPTSDYRQNDESWWRIAKRDGKYIGDLDYDESARIHSIDIALRIETDDGEFLGVLKAVYDIRDLLRLLQERAQAPGGRAPPLLTLLGADRRVIHSTVPHRGHGLDGRPFLAGGEPTEEPRVLTHVRHDAVTGRELLSAAVHSDRDDAADPGWVLLAEFDQDVLRASVEPLRRHVLWLAAGVSVIALLGGIGFALSVGRRVRRLESATAAIGAGRLDHRVEPLGHDELGGLARSINRMAVRLEQGAQAVEASEAKTRFLANMSHEIRTPLTAIVGYSDLLMDRGLSGGDRRHHSKAVRASATHLLSIINDILDLSKIEAGRIELDLARTSPILLVHEVMSLMGHQAAERGLELAPIFDAPLPAWIRADETRLRQILVNLVGNAIKFTPEGSVRIACRLHVRNEHGTLEIDVIDTGIGMTRPQAERVFQPFSQADSSTTRQYGGTGLGLTIARQLARLMDGELTALSEPGRGTTFRLTLPVGPTAELELLDDPVAWAATQRARTDDEPRPERTDLVGRRFLLAEDNVVNQKLIQTLLEKEGAIVSVVENGQLAVDEALAAQQRDEPHDVVLLDLMMPVLDGLGALAKLKAQECRAPVLALTADAFHETRDKCLRAGFDGFITKPVGREALRSAVARHLHRSPNHPRPCTTAKTP